LVVDAEDAEDVEDEPLPPTVIPFTVRLPLVMASIAPERERFPVIPTLPPTVSVFPVEVTTLPMVTFPDTNELVRPFIDKFPVRSVFPVIATSPATASAFAPIVAPPTAMFGKVTFPPATFRFPVMLKSSVVII
jgi:hypothetical protein